MDLINLEAGDPKELITLTRETLYKNALAYFFTGFASGAHAYGWEGQRAAWEDEYFAKNISIALQSFSELPPELKTSVLSTSYDALNTCVARSDTEVEGGGSEIN